MLYWVSRIPSFSQSAITLALVFGFGLMPGAAAAEAGLPPGDEDVVPSSARAVLEEAFANLYDCDTRAKIELVMRSRSGAERRRVFQTARKDIEGHLHSIGRLVEPPYLRGMTVLTIDTEERGQDAFIYFPSQRRVRRITTAQRADSFMGSDVTYEDLERPRADAYRVEFLASEPFQGEAVRVILAVPNEPRNYTHVHFLVARSDSALLATRYFKRGAERPFRILRAERDSMLTDAGHVLPTEITVENLARGTSTRVHYYDLVVNPEIEDRIFSSRFLNRGVDPLARSFD